MVPNFFLPPQQLEASLRMLSLSTALPPPVTTDQVREQPANLPLACSHHLFHESLQNPQLSQASFLTGLLTVFTHQACIEHILCVQQWARNSGKVRKRICVKGRSSLAKMTCGTNSAEAYKAGLCYEMHMQCYGSSNQAKVGMSRGSFKQM